MAADPKPADPDAGAPQCEHCGTRAGVQYDSLIGKYLCNWCWARTPLPDRRNPRAGS